MADRTVEEKVPYQPTLRAVGRYLDECRAHLMNLVEAPDGYLVRYQLDETAPTLADRRFSWDQLLGQDSLMGRKRAEEQKKRRKTEESTLRPKGGYENFLRALGFELDRGGAYTITLDELDDLMVVTYLYLDPRQGFMAHKRLIKLTPKELDTIVTDALKRRTTIEPRRGLKLL
jgi:hypothetical protein